MKKTLLLITFLFCFSIVFSQMSINDSYTIQELIQNQFIGNPSFPASNFSSSTGTDFGEENGIGYFTNYSSNFPLDQGIVLCSGDVNQIPGANTSQNNSGGWSGDLDLENYTSVSSTNDASIIEFDFVADVSQISLDFLMASEEYGTYYECFVADTFAFLVTNNTTGVTENIALVPGTITPISIVNVRSGATGNCDPQNELYFERLNTDVYSASGVSYIDANSSPINFNGQTKVFVLTTNLTVGDTYHIKIVIADAQDSLLNSALFIRNSSFGAYPVIENEPDDIVVEDLDNNGSSVFNLRNNEMQMLGSVNTSIYSFDFNYFTSQADAEANINPIANPETYTNTSNPEEVYFRMSNSYTGTAITDSFKIATSEAALSLDEFIVDNFEIYPNPVNNQLYIKSNNNLEVNKVEVYNINGQILNSHNLNSSDFNSLDFSNYAKGVYLIKVYAGKESFVKKIIK